MSEAAPLELAGVVRTFRSGGGLLAVLRGADLALAAGEIVALVLSLLATLYPSWRAARTDPVQALRGE